MLRRRSLAALRKEIEPVPPAALARFLPAWQQVVSPGRGVEALSRTIETLHGVSVPASALERLVLPARVADYAPAFLDELCATGEVVWAGARFDRRERRLDPAGVRGRRTAAAAATGRRSSRRAVAPGGARVARPRAGAVLPRSLRPDHGPLGTDRRPDAGRRRHRGRDLGSGLGRLPVQRHARTAAGTADRRQRRTPRKGDSVADATAPPRRQRLPV